MNLSNNKRYAVASPTSMGVRITPIDRQPIQTSNMYNMQATSAETNVLNIASSLGCECLALTMPDIAVYPKGAAPSQHLL